MSCTFNDWFAPARPTPFAGSPQSVLGAAILALAAIQPAAAQPAAAQPDEIVVIASRRTCRYELANRELSAHELDERAKIWALGNPVRVILPLGADRKCMIKVGMKLARQGVRLMAFVEPSEQR